MYFTVFIDIGRALTEYNMHCAIACVCKKICFFIQSVKLNVETIDAFFSQKSLIE